MNPVLKILTSVIISINRLIDSMSMKTIETVKRAFFFVITILCLVGIAIGYNMGKNSARIKSDPLAEFVNDTFKIDINKEKADGDFSSMLESEIVNESTMNNFNKSTFPTRENFNPELSKDAIESENKIPEPDIMNKPFKPETPVDEKLSTNQMQNEQSVKVLEKPFTDKKIENMVIEKPDNKTVPQENKTSAPGKKSSNKNIIEILEKDKTVIPEPIKKDTGIITK